MADIFLSVVIPCFDEIVNLESGVLDDIIYYFKDKNYSYEVIISDDGSKDGSLEFLERFTQKNEHFHIIKNRHLGKAGAVTKGMLQAKGKYVIFLDMDLATPIKEIDSLLPYAMDKFDIVIGSRTFGNLAYPFSRRILHKGMIVVRKSIVGLFHIYDTQCGFKMFTNDAAQKLFSKINNLNQGFKAISRAAVKAGFDVELLFLADRLGYKIKEVPVRWRFVETRRVNPVQDAVDAILSMLSIRSKEFKGKYKL